MRATKTALLADRIAFTLRWLVFLGLVTALGWGNGIDPNAVTLIIITAILYLGLSTLSLFEKRLPNHENVAVAIDGVIALLFAWLTFINGIPFIWFGLLPIVTGAFYFGFQGGLVISLGATLIGGVILTIDLGNAAAIQAILTPALVMLLSGLLTGFITQLAGYRLRSQQELERTRQEEASKVERDRIKALYQITSSMTATLNYQRVLDMALDLTTSALTPPEESPQMVSAFFLFDGDEMVVGSARRFTPSDHKATFPAQEGVIAESLRSSQSRLITNPDQDPEIRRAVALRSCRAVYCYPLRTSQEMFGVLVFGHPEAEFFDEIRCEILEIVGRQALVALQNARLYRDLELEKERMMEIQEEARKKLARDLHDGPTQSVAALAMRVNFARRLIDRDVRAAGEELFKIEDLARRTTKEIRHMLFTLRPLVLETSGLIAALESMAQKLLETYNQKVVIEAQAGAIEDLELGKQGVIFYIAEEAVNNARKHAEAEFIYVRLIKAHPDVLLLEIEDNGVGFNIGEVDAGYEKRGSLGMVNMRERTELVNGVIQLESTVGKGTRIRVWIPLDDAAAERLRHGKL